MPGKETKCTCRIVYGRVISITGIIAGALLAVLGIVTITADTGNLFPTNFFSWYSTTTFDVKFRDDSNFSRLEFWARRSHMLYFEWNCNSPKAIFETNSNFTDPLVNGIRTEAKNTGSELFSMDNFTQSTYYFCKSNDNAHCDPNPGYHLIIHMYKGSPFTGPGVLGNQNYRWTFFIIACLSVVFGVVMILGELHVPIITTKFTFFYYSFVKGLIYIAIGFLAMGMANVLGLFIAIYLWIVGLLNCIFGWRSITTFQWKKVGQTGTTTIVTRREYI